MWAVQSNFGNQIRLLETTIYVLKELSHYFSSKKKFGRGKKEENWDSILKKRAYSVIFGSWGSGTNFLKKEKLIIQDTEMLTDKETKNQNKK